MNLAGKLRCFVRLLIDAGRRNAEWCPHDHTMPYGKNPELTHPSMLYLHSHSFPHQTIYSRVGTARPASCARAAARRLPVVVTSTVRWAFSWG